MDQANKLIDYLRNCYKADNRELNLSNFFHDKVEHQLMLDDVGLINGEMPIYPVRKDWGENVSKDLAVYAKEKDLYACTLFLVGRINVDGKKKKVISPLLMIPAELKFKNEDYYIRVFHESTVVNKSVFNIINSFEEEDTASVNEFYHVINNEAIDFGKCAEIKNFFNDSYSNTCAEELLMFPQLLTKSKLERFKLDKDNTFAIVPAVGLGVIRKSNSTLGVLEEMEELSKQSKFSEPLKGYLSLLEDNTIEKDKNVYVPVILNGAQESVFDAVSKHTLTMVVGPPGTGKSFTIASLAVDSVCKGKSVLIVSSNNQAVDVISEKIEKDFQLKNVTVRGGGKRDYKRFLKERLSNLLSGIGVDAVEHEELAELGVKLEKHVQKTKQLEAQLPNLELSEMERGIFFTEYKGKIIQRIKKHFLKRRISKESPFWDVAHELMNALELKNESVREFIQKKFSYNLYVALRAYRWQLRDFLSAIKARTSSRKESFFDKIDFDQLKRTFPVWLVSINEISNVLPLKYELFDLVIFDEATQSDIASAVPILQRAKKVVISGDPKQLRHVSFLSRDRQRLLGEQSGLNAELYTKYNYRDKSLLDIISENIKTQEQIVFLNEHYRSLPSLIAFSNKEFYSNNLRIMTETPVNKAKNNISIHQLNGVRHEKGHNEIEASFILERINNYIDSERNVNDKLCQSIGVLSPFREQVNYLKDLINEHIELIEIKRHNIAVGTAHSFQGEERDVMFLSFVLDDNSHHSAFRHLNRSDVFNVSITRARDYQHIVTSIKNKSLKSNELFPKFLSFARQVGKEDLEKPKTKVTDTFLEEVKGYLQSLGVDEIHTAYTIAGLEIDMVIVNEEETYCIDLVGYPGKYEAAFPVERYKILNRIDIQVLPLTYSHWCVERERACAAIRRHIGIN